MIRALTFMVVPVVLLAGGCADRYADGNEPGTWSIAAIDHETGEIGIAGASCTNNEARIDKPPASMSSQPNTSWLRPVVNGVFRGHQPE